VGACVSRAILESGGDVAILDIVENPELETWSMYHISKGFQRHHAVLKLSMPEHLGACDSDWKCIILLVHSTKFRMYPYS
jgi:hypothetical protein